MKNLSRSILAVVSMCVFADNYAGAQPSTEKEIETIVTDASIADGSENKIADEFAIPENYPRICRRFATIIENQHLLRKPLNTSIAAQAWTNYLMQLDYDRSYFTQSDIENLLPWRLRLTDDLKAGNLDFAIKAFRILKKRIQERTEYVDQLLNTDMDFSIDEEYIWKRKDMPWPRNEAEQNELWRLRIKNEVLSKMIVHDFGESNKTAQAISTTNAPDSTLSTTVAVNVITNAIPDADLSPKAFVRKRYEQYKIIMLDSDAETVLQRFLSAFAMVYDPHTAYMAPTAVDDFNIDMSLSLCGIGATLTPEDGAAKIVEIIPGSPAARDTRDIRLVKGDKIIGVGQGDAPIVDVMHRPLAKIVQHIRGVKGTKVVLNVISASDPSGSTTRLVDIIRDDIKLEEQAATGRVVRVTSPAIDAAGTSTTNTRTRAFGVVYLPTFYGSMTMNERDPNFRSCTADIMKSIAKMNPEIEGLILDLRGNGGGSLREAVSLAGSFIRMGPIVLVKEISRGQENISALPDNDPAIGFRKPMVVLIDRASASASEIVAAALQDYGRAVIVGDHASHGKGSVQSVMPLLASDKSYGSLRLTIANFYRINGGSTQLRGVSSDIVLPSTLEYLDIGEDKLPNAMPWSQIQPAEYRPVYALKRHIPTLATNAYARLAKNTEYQNHLKIVNHVKDVSQRISTPLLYAKRYEQYAEEDTMGKTAYAEESEFGVGTDIEIAEDGIGKDIVLRSAIDILADLVDIQGDIGISPANDTDPSDWLFKFFR